MRSTILFLISLFLISIQAQDYQNYKPEEILSFHSEIKINEDGTMDVTETIKVHSEGIQIKRGIYRDFPTDYRDDYGNNIEVSFDVKDIKMDDRPVNYKVENYSNGKRVYIGEQNVFLDPGDYTYEITYQTDRQLGFFEDHDELYWNVTGNGWGFLIKEVTCEVHLPGEIPLSGVKATAYTGLQGDRGSDFRFTKHLGPVVKFETSRPLFPRQGLTIVVGFPKGFVKEPTTADRISYFLRDNVGSVAGLIGIIFLLIYYFVAWVKVGKDPEKGTIIPLYEPPADLSPAAVRYISEMGYDNKAFTSAILNAAVKGYIKIDQTDKDYKLILLNKNLDRLSDDEKAALIKLKFNTKSVEDYQEINKSLIASIEQLKKKDDFISKSLVKFLSSQIKEVPETVADKPGKEKLPAIELKNKNHATISASIKKLKQNLKKTYDKVYFKTNRKFFVIGAVISVIILLLIMVLSSGEAAFLTLWVAGWSIGTALLMFFVFKRWRSINFGRAGSGSAFVGAIFITLFALPFLVGEIAGLFFLLEVGSWLHVFVIAGIVLLNLIFYHLLKAPTRLGRKVMDQIDGFKMYLSIAEKDRLNLMKSPEKTPELFEKFLPYAVALGVENKWADKFSDFFERLKEEGVEYSPVWYAGAGGFSSMGVGGFTSSVSNSLSGAISSSSTAPGSSSGGGSFSGGGSSGGGGGGGGGGGW